MGLAFESGIPGGGENNKLPRIRTKLNVPTFDVTASIVRG